MNTEIVIKEKTYRIKKMNAIEILALRSQYDFNSYYSTLNLFNTVLERMEVKCNDNWLPVKEKGKEIFYPTGVENDGEVIKDLISFFTKYIKEVF